MNQLFGQPADPDRAAGLDLGPASTSMRPLPVGGAEQAFFHLDIKRSLQLHWRLARNLAIGGVAAAVLYFLAQAFWFKSWPAYQTTSLVYIQPTPPRVLEPSSGGQARWPYDTNTYESYILQQMMNVSREDVLAAALKKLKGFQGPKESDQSAEMRLVRALNVTREGTSYQFAISARAGTAQMAADIANAVTEAYIESASRDQKTGDAERMAILRDERDRIQKAMDADRAEQETLNRQLGVASVASTPDHFDEEITQTRGELVKARTDHDAAEAKFAALGAGHGPSSAAIDAEADALVANDSGLVSMKQVLNSRRALLISQMANLTPNHPQYKQDEVELQKIDTTLDEMQKDLRTKAAARIQSQLQADLQRTAGVESTMNGQLRQLVGAAGGATPKMQRSSDLAADLTRLQARFSSVDEQLHNLMLEDNAPAAAYQITPAQVPMGRTKSGVMRNAVLIVLLGIVLGILATVLAHKLDPKVYIASDVELILGFPPMAQLPDFSQVSDGVAEEYLLRLTSSIEHARKQSNLRSVVFTGTNAGNGVSMLVGRVGEMLEAMGRPTVLVDATGAPVPDLRKRLNAIDSDAVHGDGPGLVPVGRVSRPTAVLQQMAEETETQDDSIVLTDTAPLSVSAETEYLARFVDCAIVVVESGKTSRRELREVAATLQRLDVAAVGFVLNRVGLAKADPAFKSSVSAIEKHLKAQGSHAASRRPEPAKPFVPQPVRAVDAPMAQESPINNAAVRSMFEPEIAAAAAAMARVSSPAVHDASICLPTPTLIVPGDDAARRFATPLVAGEVETPGYSIMPETVPVEPAHFASVFAEPEQSDPIRSGQVHEVPFNAAPVVETAEHFSAIDSAEPQPELTSAASTDSESTSPAPASTAASAPFVEAARHFSSPLSAGRVSAGLGTSMNVAPFAEVAKHFAHVDAAETAANADRVPAFELLDESEKYHSLDYLDQVALVAEHADAEQALAEQFHVEDAQAAQAHAEPAQLEPMHEVVPVSAVPDTAPEPVVEEASLPSSIVSSDNVEALVEEHVPGVTAELPEAAKTVAAAPFVEAAPVEAAPVESTHVEQAPAQALPPEPEPISHRAGSPASDLPWWLSDQNRHGAPQRPPVLWKPAKVWMATDRATDLSAAREALESGPSVVQKPKNSDGHDAAPRAAWERVATGHDALSTDAPFDPLNRESEVPANLTSRLSGLRNLLFVMGVKDTHNPDQPAVQYPNIGGGPEMRSERRGFDRTSEHDPDFSVAGRVGGASPQLVTAPPEFLPPQPIVINVDGHEGNLGVEILPSKRGQYRKI